MPLLGVYLFPLSQGCGNTMPDLSNLSHSPEDKYEISIYLSWDKDFIALAKKNIQIIRLFFSYFWKKIRFGYKLEVPPPRYF